MSGGFVVRVTGPAGYSGYLRDGIETNVERATYYADKEYAEAVADKYQTAHSKLNIVVDVIDPDADGD